MSWLLMLNILKYDIFVMVQNLNNFRIIFLIFVKRILCPAECPACKDSHGFTKSDQFLFIFVIKFFTQS